LRQLDDVTLVAVTGVDIESAQAALQHCLNDLAFARALLVAPRPPTLADPRITHIRCQPMDLVGYSAFVLKKLVDLIDTSHMLMVQADGFVVNPERWDDSWLAYDYVGAPWPEEILIGLHRRRPRNRVGNGGFSLRSRRLMKLVQPINLGSMTYPTKSEDLIICDLLYAYLTEHGMRFADTATAASFAIERDSASFGHTLGDVFGFHGKLMLERFRLRAADNPK
jgi:hypothetical protein